MAQKEYGLKMTNGVAGGLYDISVHTVDSRCNEEEDGKLLFGHGVVEGTTAGAQVKLPVEESKRANFEGIVLHSHTREQDIYGDVSIRKGSTVGVLTKGRIYARIDSSVSPKYGERLYLIVKGENVGLFTNNSKDTNAIEVNGYFIGEKINAIAPVYVDVDKLVEEEAE